MKKQNIEVEGWEIVIQSKEGHYAVIPAKHRQEVMDMIKEGCDNCINNYIQTLPKDSDYAEDGSLIPDYLINDIKKSVKPLIKPIISNTKDVIRDIKTEVKPILKSVKDKTDEIITPTINTFTEIKENTITLGKELYGSSNEDMGDKYHNKIINNIKYNFNEIKDIPLPKKQTIGINKEKYKIDNVSKRCKDKECTSYLTNKALNEQGSNFIDTFNFRGDGWTMQQNIENAGGQKISNIYDSEDVPKVYNKSDIIKYSIDKATTTENKELLSTLEPGDYVSLLYPKSSNFEKAWNDGTMKSTHGGEIVQIGTKKDVRDNVHGELKYRLLDKVINNKDLDGVVITGAVRPTKEVEYNDLSDVGVEINRNHPDNPKYDIIHNKAAYRALKSINVNKDEIIKDNNLTISDFKTLKSLAHGIMYKESKYGIKDNNEEYNFTSGNSPLGSIANPINNVLSSMGITDEESVGLGNVKIKSNYSEDELKNKQLIDVIKDKDIIESPEFSGVITVDLLAKNYNKLKLLIKEKAANSDKLLKDDDLIESLLLISYNQGFKNIEKDIQNYNDTNDINKLDQYKSFDYPRIIRSVVSYSKYN